MILKIQKVMYSIFRDREKQNDFKMQQPASNYQILDFIHWKTDVVSQKNLKIKTKVCHLIV